MQLDINKLDLRDMQLIYILLNSRRKLPLILVCSTFNIAILVYFTRPARIMHVKEGNSKEVSHKYVGHVNVSISTEPKQRPHKEKHTMKGPVTYVRHFASKIKSFRPDHSDQKQHKSVPITRTANDIYESVLQDKVVSPTKVSGNHGTTTDGVKGFLLQNIGSRLSSSHQNDFNFEYLINPTEVCQKDTYLLITVCSAVQRVDFRKAIRGTWGSVVQKHHLGVQIVFVIGIPEEKHLHFQSAIQKESEVYKDVIQIHQVDDSKNLSFKTIAILYWIKNFCENASFVMKTDDDIFVSTPNLLKEVKDLSPRSKIMMGHLIKGARPITDRNDPWYNPPQVYKDRIYPNYLSGSAYLFPFSVIPYILSLAKTTPVFWLEDIFITGMLAKYAEISLLNNSKFIYLKPENMYDFCKHSNVQVVHGISSEEMKKFWRALNNLDC